MGLTLHGHPCPRTGVMPGPQLAPATHSSQVRPGRSPGPRAQPQPPLPRHCGAKRFPAHTMWQRGHAGPRSRCHWPDSGLRGLLPALSLSPGPLALSGQAGRKAHTLPPSAPVQSSNQRGAVPGGECSPCAYPPPPAPQTINHAPTEWQRLPAQGPWRLGLGAIHPVPPWVVGAVPRRAAVTRTCAVPASVF